MLRRRRGWAVWAILTAVCCWSALTATEVQIAVAGDPGGLPASLELAPRDAAFYWAMLRGREQIEIIGRSKAWAKLKEMPVVQEALRQYEAAAARGEEPAARVEAARKNPQIAEILATLADMFGDEVFVFGGRGWTDGVDLIQELTSAVRYAGMIAELGGSEESAEQAQARAALEVLASRLDAIRVPATIIGFKVEDTERAQRQLDALATLLGRVTMMIPQLSGRFSRTTIGDDQFYTLNLDGTMVPWEEIPWAEARELEAEPGDVNEIIERLRALKLVIALGLRGGYLLVAWAESTDVIAELGSGPKLLERAELAPLKEHADARICGVSYLSDAMARQLGNNDREIDNLLQLLEGALPHSGLDEQAQAEILRDASALAEDLKAALPDPGAVFSFSLLTGEGIEEFTYYHGEQLYLDGSKPLELMRHVGGNPLLAAVWREVHRPQDYDTVVKWIEVGYKYFEKYALPEMSPPQREQYERFAQRVWPLIQRADEVNRELLIPALKDSQRALVLDGKLNVQRFCQAVPPLDEPMPFIEPALVIGVSDPERLREACRAYREIFNGLVDALHETAPEDIPDFEIPEPKVKETSYGMLYLFPLPEEWGVDSKIVPNLGLGEHVAVVTISRDHSQRLLKETALKTDGILADADQPRAMAAVFDWAGLVSAATPWLELAARKLIRQEMGLEPDSPEGAVVMDQLHTVLDVLKTIRTCTFESYFEGDVLVTHSFMEVRDIP